VRCTKSFTLKPELLVGSGFSLGNMQIVMSDTINSMNKGLRVDRVLGVIFFVLAITSFMFTTLFDGWAVLTAGGVDVSVPISEAHRTMLVFSLSWLCSLVVGIFGLVMWIRRSLQGKRILLFALGDFILTVGLFLLAMILLG
jgi:hypothetical protein